MTPLAATDRLFFERADAELDQDTASRIVAKALSSTDDGELFLEYRESEHISLDDGRIRSAGFDTTSGFGLRAVAGEMVVSNGRFKSFRLMSPRPKPKLLSRRKVFATCRPAWGIDRACAQPRRRSRPVRQLPPKWRASRPR